MSKALLAIDDLFLIESFSEVITDMFQYGNQPELDIEYSNAALVNEVRSAEQRRQDGLCDHVLFCKVSKEYSKEYEAVQGEQAKQGGRGPPDDDSGDDHEDDGDCDYDVEVAYNGEYSM